MSDPKHEDTPLWNRLAARDRAAGGIREVTSLDVSASRAPGDETRPPSNPWIEGLTDWVRRESRDRLRERWVWRAACLSLAVGLLASLSIDWRTVWTTPDCPLWTAQVWSEEFAP